MIAIFCKTTFIHDYFHNNHKLLVESRPNIYSTAINGITVKLIKIFKARVNRSIKRACLDFTLWATLAKFCAALRCSLVT